MKVFDGFTACLGQLQFEGKPTKNEEFGGPQAGAKEEATGYKRLRRLGEKITY